MNRPIRVLELINGYAVEGPLGGAERFAIEMAVRMEPSLVQAQFFGLWNWDGAHQERWRQRLMAAGIPAHEGPAKDDRNPYQNFLAALRAIRQAVREPIDIIHSHSEFGDVAALLLKRPLHARAAIRTVHLGREWSKRPLRRLLLTQLTYPLTFDAEFAVAQQMVDGLNARPVARLSGRRATVTYNALDFARFDKAIALRADATARRTKRAQLGLPADATIIGAIGRLVPLKGFDFLLEAARIVLARDRSIHFIIAGHGEQAAHLEQLAAALGVDQHVHFLGARSDVEELYAVMDLYVSSSLWEGLPTTVLEAMAAGTPVVATRVSGSVELVRAGETGWLTAPGDATALAATLTAALAAPAESAAMAARAQVFVRRNFDLRTIAQRHQMLYAQVLAGRR